MDKRWISELLNKGTALYARMPPSEDGRLAWVAVVPLDPERSRPLLNRHGIAPHLTPRFCVRAFEITLETLEAGGFFSEDEILRRRDQFADDLEGVASILKSLGVDPNDLDQPWKSNYPL